MPEILNLNHSEIEMAKTCNTCGKTDTSVLACHGVCEKYFHPSCIRRLASSKTEINVICKDCTELRPCHILRFLKMAFGRIDQVADDSEFVANKVKALWDKWSLMDDLSNDQQTIAKNLEAVVGRVSALHDIVSNLADTNNTCARKISALEEYIADLDPVFSQSSGSSSQNLAVMPVLDSLKRNMNSIKDDVSSCKSSLRENVKQLSNLGDELKKTTPSGLTHLLPVKKDAICQTDDFADDVNIPPVTPNTSDSRNQQNKKKKKTKKTKKSRRPNGNSTVPQSRHADAQLLTIPTVVDTPVSLLPDVNNEHLIVPTIDADRNENSAEHHSLTDESAGSSHQNVALTATANPQHPASQQPSSPDSQDATLPAAGYPKLPFYGRLMVAERSKDLFVSNLHPSTCVDDVTSHILDMLRYCDVDLSTNQLFCKQINSLAMRDGLRMRASFKIAMPNHWYDIAVREEFWPAGAIVREFLPKQHGQRHLRPASGSKNFMAPGPSMTPA